jgi:hypothetical protein
VQHLGERLRVHIPLERALVETGLDRSGGVEGVEYRRGVPAGYALDGGSASGVTRGCELVTSLFTDPNPTRSASRDG